MFIRKLIYNTNAFQMMIKLAVLSASFVLISELCAEANTDAKQNINQLDYKLNPNMSIMNIDKVRDNYSQITGKNVVVGVMEAGFNTNHPALIGRNKYEISNNTCWDSWCDPFKSDPGKKLTYAHGNHVTGIILGNKPEGNYNKTMPYGIAYEAQYHGVGMLTPGSLYTGNTYDEFKDKEEVRIINNSWGVKLYPLINRFDAAFEYNFKGQNTPKGYQKIQDDKDFESIDINKYFSLINKEWEIGLYKPEGKENFVVGLYKLSQERKVLNIFGAGNYGIVSPSAVAVLPSYDESIRSWLVVGALNMFKSDSDGNITQRFVAKDGDKIKIDKDGVLMGSNHFKGPASLYAVMTPGQFIYSSNAYSKSYHDEYNRSFMRECVDTQGTTAEGDYCYMSGTSMATPMVTGVAALIQEQFPFMDGAEIADTILTTANNNIEAPKVLVKQVTNGLNTQYSIIYITDYNGTTTQNGGNKIPKKMKIESLTLIKSNKI